MVYETVVVGHGPLRFTFDVRGEKDTGDAAPFSARYGFAGLLIVDPVGGCLNSADNLTGGGGLGVPFECHGLAFEYVVNTTNGEPGESRARRLTGTEPGVQIDSTSVETWNSVDNVERTHVYSVELDFTPDDVTTMEDETSATMNGELVCDQISGGEPPCGFTLSPRRYGSIRSQRRELALQLLLGQRQSPH